MATTDINAAGAAKVCQAFIRAAGLPQRNGVYKATAEKSVIHGKTRPLWRFQYASGLKFKVDIQTRKVVSFYDFGREEAQFKGTQPKLKPAITSQQQAKQILLTLARKLGIPSSCTPDSFDFKVQPGQSRYTAGRAGMTFKNKAGERVAGLSIDLLDGGLNGFWFAPWE